MILEKEIFLDGASMLNSLFANDLINNTKITEKALKIKIVARDCWIKLLSNNQLYLDRAYSFISELINVHESGHLIHQKDFELILKSTTSNNLQIKDFYNNAIKVSPTKDCIIPRTIAQHEYINDIKQKDIIFGVGPAGTGKTYLAMAMAISSYLEGKYSRIILTRPAMEAGESLGFLPGSLEEKIKPYLRPLYDALYDMMDFDEANKLIETNIIEVAPLAFMRGRTLNNSFIILDEAQNTTPEQMMMFLTRLGFDSKCIVTGDPSQTDLPSNKTSGLVHATKVLYNVKELAFKTFTSKDVVRNPLVEKIINAYDKHRELLTKTRSK
jgi:phosphate starvation-inducible protein PhoH and related proteins